MFQDGLRKHFNSQLKGNSKPTNCSPSELGWTTWPSIPDSPNLLLLMVSSSRSRTIILSYHPLLNLSNWSSFTCNCVHVSNGFCHCSGLHPGSRHLFSALLSVQRLGKIQGSFLCEEILALFTDISQPHLHLGWSGLPLCLDERNSLVLKIFQWDTYMVPFLLGI